MYDFDEGLLLDPVAHSPLEDLVDMALRELHEEEALCGSVGSASSSFDLFNSQNKVRRPNNQTNTAKLPVAVKLNDSESISDFLMDDELNLSDPTKSSWRREVVNIIDLFPILKKRRCKISFCVNSYQSHKALEPLPMSGAARTWR